MFSPPPNFGDNFPQPFQPEDDKVDWDEMFAKAFPPFDEIPLDVVDEEVTTPHIWLNKHRCHEKLFLMDLCEIEGKPLMLVRVLCIACGEGYDLDIVNVSEEISGLETN